MLGLGAYNDAGCRYVTLMDVVCDLACVSDPPGCRIEPSSIEDGAWVCPVPTDGDAGVSVFCRPGSEVVSDGGLAGSVPVVHYAYTGAPVSSTTLQCAASSACDRIHCEVTGPPGRVSSGSVIFEATLAHVSTSDGHAVVSFPASRRTTAPVVFYLPDGDATAAGGRVLQVAVPMPTRCREDISTAFVIEEGIGGLTQFFIAVALLLLSCVLLAAPGRSSGPGSGYYVVLGIVLSALVILARDMRAGVVSLGAGALVFWVGAAAVGAWRRPSAAGVVTVHTILITCMFMLET